MSDTKENGLVKQGLNDDDMVTENALGRRSMLTKLGAGVAGSAALVVGAQSAVAVDRDQTRQGDPASDSDSGNNADRAGDSDTSSTGDPKGGRRRRQGDPASDSDSGNNADRAGDSDNGGGGRRQSDTADSDTTTQGDPSSDSDTGNNADRAGDSDVTRQGDAADSD